MGLRVPPATFRCSRLSEPVPFDASTCRDLILTFTSACRVISDDIVDVQGLQSVAMVTT